MNAIAPAADPQLARNEAFRAVLREAGEVAAALRNAEHKLSAALEHQLTASAVGDTATAPGVDDPDRALVARLIAALRERDAEIGRLASIKQNRDDEIVILQDDLRRLGERLAADKQQRAGGDVPDREATERSRHEVAQLTRMLHAEQRRGAEQTRQRHWLQAVAETLDHSPPWWARLTAARLRSWRSRRLRRLNLFNPDAYAAAHPDVAAAGLDPFDHYLRHGLGEARANPL